MSRIETSVSSFSKTTHENDGDSSEDEFYGPVLPSYLKLQEAGTEYLATHNNDLRVGVIEKPTVHEIIGPLPVNSIDNIDTFVTLERQSRLTKGKLLGDDVKQPKREEWMIELPELNRKNFGLGPRIFNLTDKPECLGRDQWTSIPTSTATTSLNKNDKGMEKRNQNFEKQRNEKFEKVVTQFDKRKRSESLLDMHRKELKLKKGKPIEIRERKPFDREEDLKLNNLNDSKRKALIKKSQELNSKFKPGNRKFL